MKHLTSLIFSSIAIIALFFGARYIFQTIGVLNTASAAWEERTLIDGSHWEIQQNTGKIRAVTKRVDKHGNRLYGAGYAPVTGYQTMTTSRVSATATTIPVASVTDKAGNAITTANISASSTVRMYFNLEAGTVREEPFVCTGISGLNLTGCTRGIQFQGNDLTGSSTIAVTHNAGSSVIMTNLGVMYGNEFVSISGNQIKYDVLQFDSFPRVTSSAATYLPVNAFDFATKQYVDNVGAGGFTASNVSSSLGLISFAGVTNCPTAAACVGINISTTSSGLIFDTLANKNRLILAVSSTGFTYIDSLGNLAVATTGTLNWTGTMRVTTAPTGTTDVVNMQYADASYFGNGADSSSTITTSATATRDMYYTNLTIANGATYAPNGFHIYATGTITVSPSSFFSVAGFNGTTGTGSSISVPSNHSTTTSMVLSIGTPAAQGWGCAAGVDHVGFNSTGTAFSLGASGGNSGGDGTNAGGTAGLVTQSSATNTLARFARLGEIFMDQVFGAQLRGGSGGAGGSCHGGGGGGSSAGSGGEGGGILWASARHVINNGTITAAGGFGGSSVGTSGSTAGGGGGGGGGSIYLRYQDYAGTGTLTAAGGAFGTGALGASVNGVAGSAGTILQVTIP